MGEARSKKEKSSAEPLRQTSGTATSKGTGSITYGKAQYRWVLIGIGCIALGLILMYGGWMPSPEVWDESIIYSPRRLTLAPIMILIGLGFQIYAIFKVD